MADFGQFWPQNLKLQPEIRQHPFEVFLRFLANYDVSRRMNMGLTPIPDIGGTLRVHVLGPMVVHTKVFGKMMRSRMAKEQNTT